MNSLPSEIIYHVMTYCDKILRYFTLKNNTTYLPYLNNDRKVILFAARYALMDYKLLYKYPKSLARYYWATGHSEDDFNKYIKRIYSDPNDIVNFAIRSLYNIDLTDVDLSNVPPKKIIKLIHSTRPSDWEKYILNDAETIFRVHINTNYNRIFRDKGYIDMIPDDVILKLSTDIRFSWLKLTRKTLKENTFIIRHLNDDELNELKKYPKYLAGYFHRVICDDKLTYKQCLQIINTILEKPIYVYETLSRIWCQDNMYYIDDDDIRDRFNHFRNVLTAKFYEKYEDNESALYLMGKLSIIDDPYIQKLICKRLSISSITTENAIRIKQNFGTSDYLCHNTYDKFITMLRDNCKNFEKPIDLIDNNEYIEIILKEMILYGRDSINKYRNGKYKDIIDKFYMHMECMNNEITM